MDFFPTTHWSVVIRAGEKQSEAAGHALEQLCRTYWYPLYSFARHQGHTPHDAEDLTQGFFAHLLGTEGISSVQPEEGKFRSFLLTCFRNFAAKAREQQLAIKRGGGCSIISIDQQEAEDRLIRDLSHAETPETLYEKNWALLALNEAYARLEQHYIRYGKEKLFACLHRFLEGRNHLYPGIMLQVLPS